MDAAEDLPSSSAVMRYPLTPTEPVRLGGRASSQKSALNMRKSEELCVAPMRCAPLTCADHSLTRSQSSPPLRRMQMGPGRMSVDAWADAFLHMAPHARQAAIATLLNALAEVRSQHLPVRPATARGQVF